MTPNRLLCHQIIRRTRNPALRAHALRLLRRLQASELEFWARDHDILPPHRSKRQ